MSAVDSHYMVVNSFGHMLANGSVSTPFMPHLFNITPPSKFCEAIQTDARLKVTTLPLSRQWGENHEVVRL